MARIPPDVYEDTANRQNRRHLEAPFACMKGNPKKSHLYHTTIWRGPQAGWCLRANPGGAQFPLHAYNPTKGQASCQILDNSSVPQIPRHLRTLISHPGPFLFHHSRDGHYRLRSL